MLSGPVRNRLDVVGGYYRIGLEDLEQCGMLRFAIRSRRKPLKCLQQALKDQVRQGQRRVEALAGSGGRENGGRHEAQLEPRPRSGG